MAAAAGGCGGDDEPDSDTGPGLPGLNAPREEPTVTSSEPETQPETQPAPTPTPPAPEPDGGATAPEPTPPADTPENDVPPPADSPAERFEDFCNENPGACG